MFERLERHVRAAAEAQAARRREEMAATLAAELPAGIEAERTEEGVRLRGRGLRRRLALEPALRALTGRRT